MKLFSYFNNTDNSHHDEYLEPAPTRGHSPHHEEKPEGHNPTPPKMEPPGQVRGIDKPCLQKLDEAFHLLMKNATALIFFPRYPNLQIIQCSTYYIISP